jgi:hypothetical protein
MKKTLRAASTLPIVPSLPSSHRMACSGSGRIFGQNFAQFENAVQDGPNQFDRPESKAIPQPAELVVKLTPVTSG